MRSWRPKSRSCARRNRWHRCGAKPSSFWWSASLSGNNHHRKLAARFRRGTHRDLASGTRRAPRSTLKIWGSARPGIARSRARMPALLCGVTAAKPKARVLLSPAAACRQNRADWADWRSRASDEKSRRPALRPPCCCARRHGGQNALRILLSLPARRRDGLVLTSSTHCAGGIWCRCRQAELPGFHWRGEVRDLAPLPHGIRHQRRIES